MLMNKTELYLILEKSLEYTNRIYFHCNFDDTLNINNPKIHISLKVDAVVDTMLGIQLHTGPIDNYIDLNATTDSFSNGFKCSLNCRFNEEKDEQGLYIHFNNSYIHINGITENLYNDIIKNIEKHKSDYRKKKLREDEENRLCNAMMSDNFWESIDNMREY